MAASQRSQLISLYEVLIRSWNNRDAKGMAALYANGGGQIGFDGSQISGPGDIEKHLAPIFRDHPTARFVFIIKEVRLLGEAMGLVRAIAGMVPRDSTDINSSLNTVQTMLARKQRSLWKIELFQNTPARLDGRPDDVAAMTQELQAVVKTQL
ncbi:MAG TPA: SgcJ/EcaC family oxidoreductase [Aestuariivirga sp.]|nr:SgcJ/EcaC family oxidoreductase [Aestuariivirga sp.]